MPDRSEASHTPFSLQLGDHTVHLNEACSECVCETLKAEERFTFSEQVYGLQNQ